MELFPLFDLLGSFLTFFILFFSLFIFPLTYSNLLESYFLIGLRVIDDSCIVCFLKHARFVLEFDCHVRSKLWNLEIFYFLISNHLIYENVLGNTLRCLINDDWVSLRSNIILEEIVSDTLFLQNDFILHDLFVSLARMQNRNLRPRSWN